VKLLLDENLSDRIVNRINDLYPESEHVKTLALTNTDDVIIWEYAKVNDFVIVSKDSDFHDSQFTLWSSTEVYLSPD
jgi:predicted nuclease of predicted toxin-antitoxin system